VSRAAVLRIIGLIKLAKGGLLVAAGLELLRVGQNGVGSALAGSAMRFHVDPDGRYVRRAVQSIAGLDGHHLEVVSTGLVAYGALFLLEGTGLVLRKRWGEYVTILITGSFIPLELYEIMRHPDWIRAAVAFVNIAIVWYLARGLRRRQRAYHPTS
jgi:uncharacterized membrane protein (DUF2068 family)